jgi:hypothetical protein
MPLLVTAATVLLCVITPWRDWRGSIDQRNYDGVRYTELCVGRYQIPETWLCVDVYR